MNNILVLGAGVSKFLSRRDAKKINGKWRTELVESWQRVSEFFQRRRSKKFSAEFFFRVEVFVLCPSRLSPPLLLLTNFPTKQLFPPLKISQVSQDVCFVLLSTDSPSFETNLFFPF